MRKVDFCKGCGYRAAPGAPNGCDYGLITGRSKLKDCPVGAECTPCALYTPGDQVDRRKKPECRPVSRKPDKYAARRRMYDVGWTDRQIATALGLGEGAIRVWRKNHSLPANGRMKK